MSVNRRKFLQQAALAAAASATTPLLSWGQRRPEVDGPELAIGPGASGGHGAAAHLGVSRSTFENLVGSSFSASPRAGDSSPVWLRLISVDELPGLAPVNTASMSVLPKLPISPVPTTTGYMLAFNAPGTSLQQDMYIFENERMGKFDLFIVPGTLGTYTAVFNLLEAPRHGRIIITSHENGSPNQENASPAPAVNTHGKGLGLGHAAGSGAASPAQELVEPVLRDRFETKLPE